MTLDRLKRLYNHVSELLENTDQCAYCGAVATVDEHVVPYSYISPYSSKRRRNPRTGHNMVVVRACASCNSIAGSNMFDNFWMKKLYIGKRLREKNRSLLSGKPWTEQELEELSGRLQLQMYSDSINRKFIELRLENLEKPEVFGEPNDYQD